MKQLTDFISNFKVVFNIAVIQHGLCKTIGLLLISPLTITWYYTGHLLIWIGEAMLGEWK